jgi:hypothetical protein
MAVLICKRDIVVWCDFDFVYDYDGDTRETTRFLYRIEDNSVKNPTHD